MQGRGRGQERQSAKYSGHVLRPLQELVAAVGRSDRSATARLLEAKQRVERDLENGSSELSKNLDNLAVVMGQAMASLGSRDPGPYKP